MELPSSEADQQAVIDFLMSPAAYGECGPVERIDTHAAAIFLVGERAYKLKRAVKYSYLDFSTQERRRRVCEAELELNRRTAPDLYLELRSVCRTSDGTFRFGEGEPVDWLVVMRRFAADDLLEAVAQRGKLSNALVRDLADEIARFHDKAEVVALDGGRRVRDVIDGNSRSLEASAVLPPGDCHVVTEASLTVWASLSPLLDRRAEDGHVRHCHGDLHLANICLWQGKPTLFDCLEFDSNLATADVLYDLAFLLMDLWERGFHPEASLLFNRYLDMREEGGGVAALPLFLSMRAAIRAHVSSTAATRQAKDGLRDEKIALARDYLAAARSFLQQSAPRLVAIGGLSGSGKSTISRLLAPDLQGAPGARWLRTDVLRKRMAGTTPEARLSEASYTPEASAAVYRRLLSDAAESLAAGRSVIVDGVFAKPAEREQIAGVAADARVRFSGLWLTAAPDVLVERVDARHGDASDADRTIVERQLTYEVGDLAGWTAVDSSGSISSVLDEARRRLV